MENRQEINRFNNLLTAIQNGDLNRICELRTNVETIAAELADQYGLYTEENNNPPNYLYRRDENQNTPFHLALQTKNKKIATFFELIHKLENGQENVAKNQAEFNRQNRNGDTVLHIIARKGYTQYRQILEKLRDKNYLTDELMRKTNRSGVTAYFIARAALHMKIANILSAAENRIYDDNQIQAPDHIDHRVNVNGVQLNPDVAAGRLEYRLKKIRGNACGNAFSIWFLVSFGIALSSSIVTIISSDPCCKEGNEDLYLAIKLGIFGLSLIFSLIGIGRAHENFKKAREEVTTYYLPTERNPRFWVPLLGGMVSAGLQGFGLFGSTLIGQPTARIFTATAPLVHTVLLGRTEAIIKEETSELKNLTFNNDFLENIRLNP